MNKRKYNIEFYKDNINEWRFRIKASNGRIVADSGEGYKTKFFCNRNAKKLMENLSQASVKIKQIDMSDIVTLYCGDCNIATFDQFYIVGSVFCS